MERRNNAPKRGDLQQGGFRGKRPERGSFRWNKRRVVRSESEDIKEERSVRRAPTRGVKGLRRRQKRKNSFIISNIGEINNNH